MCRSSGKFCWAFSSTLEAFLEPGVFNLLQTNMLASAGGWVFKEECFDRLFTVTWAVPTGCLGAAGAEDLLTSIISIHGDN